MNDPIQAAPHRPRGSVMNPRRVIVWTTVGIFLVLSVVTALFGGIPAWPMLLWFAISHVFFCCVIARVKPYHGPYVEPLADPGEKHWPK